MSISVQFAAGVRLQLFESDPSLQTSIVHGHFSFGLNMPATLRVDRQCGHSYASVYNPKDCLLGYAVTVESGAVAGGDLRDAGGPSAAHSHGGGVPVASP